MFSETMSKIHPDDVPKLTRRVVIDEKLYCKDSLTVLTVWKKSLLFSCSGFTVFDPNGNIVFRVDNYCSDSKNEVVLMNAAGIAILTMRRKKLSLRNEWQGFLGEFQAAQKPLFAVRRRRTILFPSKRKTLAKVYLGSSDRSKLHCEYLRIEGCYAKRSFTSLTTFGYVVAEVKPKQVKPDISLGGDVFNLIIRPGYDQAFVMGLIIGLDKMMGSK